MKDIYLIILVIFTQVKGELSFLFSGCVEHINTKTGFHIIISLTGRTQVPFAIHAPQYVTVYDI